MNNDFAKLTTYWLVALLAVTAWSSGELGPFAAAKEPQPSVTRDPAYWPFDAQGPWNHPIGSGAIYEPIQSTWKPADGGFTKSVCYTIPTYVATASDPLRNIYKRPYNTPGPGNLVDTIRVPDAAERACGTDGQLNIIDPTHSVVSEMFDVIRLANGDLSTAGGYIKNDLRGPGAAFSGWHGTLAAGMSALGGMIRLGELTNGTAGLGQGIRHALQGEVWNHSLNQNAPGRRTFVWPASSSDVLSGGSYSRTGNLFMGSLLAIPPWVDINTIGIADPKALAIAKAMQDYGIYIVDTAGDSMHGRPVIGIKIDPQVYFTGETPNAEHLNGTLQVGVAIACRYLQVVTNSHNGGFAPAVLGGGGTPRRQLAPGF